MDPITAAASVAGAIQLTTQISRSLSGIHSGVNTATGYLNNKSLVDITKVARVEPICLVDADVSNFDYITDIMQSMQSIFSGYYLQAIALTNKIGDISISQKLAPLNPNRGSMFESMNNDIRLSVESYKHRLPTNKNTLAIQMEAENTAASTDKNVNATILELSNLSIGKLYDVELCDGVNKVKVKIAIRLMVNSVPTSVMVNLLSFKDQFDMDIKERYHAWKAGRLSFVKDLILCKDLVDKHRSNLMKDNSEIYTQILNRENNNFKAGLFSSNPSLATASNLAVISTDTIAQVEQRIGGKFSNFKMRQQLFDNTNLMIMAVVDKSWERVTWYYRGIQESSQVSIRDMKVSNKGGNDGVTDIMKAFIAGSSPNL